MLSDIRQNVEHLEWIQKEINNKFMTPSTAIQDILNELETLKYIST